MVINKMLGFYGGRRECVPADTLIIPNQKYYIGDYYREWNVEVNLQFCYLSFVLQVLCPQERSDRRAEL